MHQVWDYLDNNTLKEVILNGASAGTTETISNSSTKIRFKHINPHTKRTPTTAITGRFHQRTWDMPEHRQRLLITSITQRLKWSLHRKMTAMELMIGTLQLRYMRHQVERVTSRLEVDSMMPSLMNQSGVRVDRQLFNSMTWIRRNQGSTANSINPMTFSEPEVTIRNRKEDTKHLRASNNTSSKIDGEATKRISMISSQAMERREAIKEEMTITRIATSRREMKCCSVRGWPQETTTDLTQASPL